MTGGSQGSLNINRNFYPVLPEVLKSYNVIHQAGSNDREHLVFAAEYGGSYISKDFFSDDEMAENIKISDIIITRAGATTLAEIADQSKPMIIIPYKYASGNHQSKNADVYRQKNAAIVIQDDDLSPTLLATTIRELESDHEKMELLGNNAKNNFGLNALSLICKTILEEVK